MATSTDGRGSRVSRTVVAIAAGLIALSVYVPRVCRALSVMGDSAVFVSAAVSFGVPQPSGYPLYTALAHAATFMPFGTLPFRVHLSSAVYHAVTVALVAAIIRAARRYEYVRHRTHALSFERTAPRDVRRLRRLHDA